MLTIGEYGLDSVTTNSNHVHANLVKLIAGSHESGTGSSAAVCAASPEYRCEAAVHAQITTRLEILFTALPVFRPRANSLECRKLTAIFSCFFKRQPINHSCKLH